MTLFRLEAVRVVAAGDALLAPVITRRLIAEFARLRPPQRTRPVELAALTRRETEILSLVAAGLSNHEIAHRLVLSNETVKTHVSHVLRKLGCATEHKPLSPHTSPVSSSPATDAKQGDWNTVGNALERRGVGRSTAESRSVVGRRICLQMTNPPRVVRKLVMKGSAVRIRVSASLALIHRWVGGLRPVCVEE